MSAPVTPADFEALVPSPTSSMCDRVKNTLIEVPTKLSEFMSWMLDAEGNLSDAFLAAISAATPADSSVPTGLIAFWPLTQDSRSSTVPDGWAICDGRAISRTDYADLFALYGTRYGVGNGTTTFNVPDYRGKFLCGAGGTDYEGATIARGGTGGASGVTLTLDQIPSHQHGVGSDDPTNLGGGTGNEVLDYLGASGSYRYTALAGGGEAHDNLPPYVAGWYLVKL